MVNTTLITGILRDASGVILPNTMVQFTRPGPAAQDGAVITSKTVSATSDASGVISVNLYTGNYDAKIMLSPYPEQFQLPVPAPSGTAVDWSGLVNGAPTVVTPDAVLDAQAAAAAAQAAFTSFDARYLGAKTAAPTLDNNGQPLIVGALYFNATSSAMFEWTGTAWQGATGPAGPTGPTGAAGPTGATGPAGPALNLASDPSPQLGGFLDTNGKYIRGSLGTAQAAAPTVTPPMNGNTFHITGIGPVAGFTASASKIGQAYTVIADGALQLTNGAGFLVEGGTRTLAAGDTFQIVQDTATLWRAFGFSAPATAAVNAFNDMTELVNYPTRKFSGTVILSESLFNFSEVVFDASYYNWTDNYQLFYFPVPLVTGLVKDMTLSSTSWWQRIRYTNSTTLTIQSESFSTLRRVYGKGRL